MKSFKFNRKKEDLLPVMKAKAEKANIKMTKEKDKISLMLETGKFQNGEDAVPAAQFGAFGEGGAGRGHRRGLQRQNNKHRNRLYI